MASSDYFLHPFFERKNQQLSQKSQRIKSMDISVIVPLLNEEESLPELTEWIARVMNEHQFSYEVILVDDGSTDTSWEVIESLHKKMSVSMASVFNAIMENRPR